MQGEKKRKIRIASSQLLSIWLGKGYRIDRRAGGDRIVRADLIVSIFSWPPYNFLFAPKSILPYGS